MIINKMRDVLKSRRWNLTKLSQKAGIGYSTAYNLFHNITRRYDGEVLDRICKVLGCQVNDLLTYVDTTLTVSPHAKDPDDLAIDVRIRQDSGDGGPAGHICTVYFDKELVASWGKESSRVRYGDEAALGKGKSPWYGHRALFSRDGVEFYLRFCGEHPTSFHFNLRSGPDREDILSHSYDLAEDKSTTDQLYSDRLLKQYFIDSQKSQTRRRRTTAAS